MPNADPKSFLHVPRKGPDKRPVEERVNDDAPVYLPVLDERAQEQAHRCMDCGVPFCQDGCPLGNRIPDWNRLASKGDWKEAYEQLDATNNFPEVTGRICPAPCESACVAALVSEPVTIEQIEQAIIERAFREGWVQPQPPDKRTRQRVAVIGSGPAGLACAQQLNRAGHRVVVFERDDRPGGLLRYGVPDFKLQKSVIDRRLDLMREEGIVFACGVEAGVDVPVRELREGFDALVLCVGATDERDLAVPGRELDGIHFAWPYLHRHSKRVAGDDRAYLPDIDAAGKDVVVVGGGDTASDCIGTAHRQGAASITNVTHGPQPPESRPPHQPWPADPDTLRVSISHEEGVDRVWTVDVVGFAGNGDGRVEAVRLVDTAWETDAEGRRTGKQPMPDTERTMPADLVLLAIGYQGPDADPLLGPLDVTLDGRGRVETDDWQTAADGIFASGDATRGASLVVWAIADGRDCAQAVNAYLQEKRETRTAQTAV